MIKHCYLVQCSIKLESVSYVGLLFSFHFPSAHCCLSTKDVTGNEEAAYVPSGGEYQLHNRGSISHRNNLYFGTSFDESNAYRSPYSLNVDGIFAALTFIGALLQTPSLVPIQYWQSQRRGLSITCVPILAPLLIAVC